MRREQRITSVREARYRDRKQATIHGKLASGNPNDFPTIVYQTTWQGVVDFDAAGPTLTATAQSKKLRRAPRTYTIRTAIDGHEPNIKYSVDIRAGRSYLALKTGATSSGKLVVKSTIRARSPQDAQRRRPRTGHRCRR